MFSRRRLTSFMADWTSQSVSLVPGTVADLHAWYLADVLRSLAAILDVPTTTAFKAAALVHKFLVSCNEPASLSGNPALEYRNNRTVHIAGAALLAACKVDCVTTGRLGAVATACHRLCHRRLAPAHDAMSVPELLGAENEALRCAIVGLEWSILEASGFFVTCACPHPYVLAFIRTVCPPLSSTSSSRPDAAGVSSRRRGDDDSDSNSSASSRSSSSSASGSSRACSEDPVAELPLSEFAVNLLNAAFAFCNDAMRSRELVLSTNAEVIAAAALSLAADAAQQPLDRVDPEWTRILGVPDRLAVNVAIAHIRTVTCSSQRAATLLNVLHRNPATQVVTIKPQPVSSPTLRPANSAGAAALASVRDKRSKRDKRDKDKSSKRDKSSRDKSGKKHSSDKRSKRDKHDKRSKKSKSDKRSKRDDRGRCDDSDADSV